MFLYLMAYEPCGLFNNEAILVEEHRWEDKVGPIFPKGISRK